MRRRIVSEPRDYEPWPVESVVEEEEADAGDRRTDSGEHRSPAADVAPHAAERGP